jgi:hypothetical protein
MDTLDADAAGQEIAAAWIAKEKLRHALNLRARITGSVPCERSVRDRLFAFYDWCAQNDDIPEILSLAKTVSRWEDQIVCAVLTGVTNATSESLSRLAKLEARLAYGFRNPANQRRRVKMACTRGTRRRSLNATTRKRRPVISYGSCSSLVRHEAYCYIARKTGRDERRLSLDLMPNQSPKGRYGKIAWQKTSGRA